MEELLIWITQNDENLIYKIDPRQIKEVSEKSPVNIAHNLHISFDAKANNQFYYGKDILENKIPILLTGLPNQSLYEKLGIKKISYINAFSSKKIDTIILVDDE